MEKSATAQANLLLHSAHFCSCLFHEQMHFANNPNIERVID
jgi:hypothetical protein